MRSFVLCTYLIACTQVVQLAPDPLGNLVTIELTPNDATLTITDLAQAPQTLGYHAIGVFSDGSRRDITTMLNWSVDNMAPGGFLDPGTYTTSNAAAGHVGVTARSNDGVIATAALTVIVDATVIDPSYPGDPTLFDPSIPIIAGDPNSPSYVYPSDGTEMPQGVTSTLFQAAVGSGFTLELTFDADVLHLAVITTADRWDTGSQIQQLLAQSSIGSAIDCGIEASATAGTIYGGPPIALTFDVLQPGGSIYYWSAATNGIMLGALSSPSAPKLFPGDTSCVGCHSASRDGQSIGMAYGSESMPLLQTIDADTLATTIDRAQMLPGGWSTFSPDRTLVLVAGSGALELRDAQTGMPVGSDGKIALPAGHYATHPDWSPDGNSVAIAYTTTPPSDLSVGSASIAVLPYKGSGTFGTPITLVTAVGLDNDYFPRYSPDGSFIAYVHATEPSQGAASAELWLVPSTGGTPIALQAASHTVSSMTSVANTADTMPTWAPMPGPHTYLAFTSSRAYGVVLPSNGESQIWVSAIDLTNTTDPSAPAFWLPCQDVTVLNNNPVWTFDSTAPQ
ncbi:MAG TPA: hypothetical protein VGG74_35525 [Kofleriaceae bacterium]